MLLDRPDARHAAPAVTRRTVLRPPAYGVVLVDAAGVDPVRNRVPVRCDSSVESVLSRWSALGPDRGGAPVRPVCVVARDVARLSAGLRGLSSEAGRFVVVRATRMLPADDGHSGLPVVAETATAAVAVAAALLGAVRRRGRSPGGTRVLITGASRMPVLRPLLTVAGFGEVIGWECADAGHGPLHLVAQEVDAVVDLGDGGRQIGAAARGRPELIIITPDLTAWALLVLPGLLRALATAPDPRLDVAVYHACALALADAGPPGRFLPRPTDPAVGPAIEEAAALALRGGAGAVGSFGTVDAGSIVLR